MRRNRRLVAAAALGGAALITAGTASYASARQLRVSHHEVALVGQGRIRVVQLSDLHLGRSTSRALLRQALRAVRDSKPDLIVMTGDYLNHSLRFMPDLDRFLAELGCAAGCTCVATLGNHDYWSGAPAIRAALERRGVHVLGNSHLVLRVGGRALTVVGVDDGRTRRADVERAFAGVSDPGRALVITHFPTTAREIVARG